MVRQSNAVAAPIFYPDGGQCIPETSLHLTLRDMVGFKILYSTDYSTPTIENLKTGSTVQYSKPILMRDLRGGEVLIKAVSVSDDGMTQSIGVARAFHINSDPPAVVEEAERFTRRQKVLSSTTSVNAAMTPPTHLGSPPLEMLSSSEGIYSGYQSGVSKSPSASPSPSPQNMKEQQVKHIPDAFSQSPSQFGASGSSNDSSGQSPFCRMHSASSVGNQPANNEKSWSGVSKEGNAKTFSSRPPPPTESFDTKPLPPPPENEVTSLDYLSSILDEEKQSPEQTEPTSDNAQHVCDHCGRSWTLLERMLRHKVHCRGPSRPSKSRSPSRKVHWGGPSSQVVSEGVKSETQSNNSGYSGNTTVTHQSYISGGGTSTGLNSSYTGRGQAAFRSTSHDSNGSFSNCNSVLSNGTSGGRTGGRLGFSSPPNSTHSSMTRGSRISLTGHPKPNIKSPNRKPLSQPKSMKPCPWCGREMKEAALETHVRRCTEEPSIKKMQAIETENRRRARLSNGSTASNETTVAGQQQQQPQQQQQHPILRKRSSFSGSLSSIERSLSDDTGRRSASSQFSHSSPGISVGHTFHEHLRHSDPPSPTDRDAAPIRTSAALQGRRDARKRAKRSELTPETAELKAF